VPYISLVAKKQIEKLSIFGGDYNTHDGTGVRDYIHVVDLAKGHLKSLDLMNKTPEYFTINLSTGTGYSVLDIVKAFEHVSGQKIPYEIISKREGDIAASFGDSSFAKEVIDWQAEYSLERMCIDTWRWVSNNPDGF